MDDNFEGVKVMVVDDRKTIRRTAKTLLSKVVCEVVTAMDGFDALAKIADTQPAIIFVDIMMPLSSARSISNKRLSLVLIDFWGNLSGSQPYQYHRRGYRRVRKGVMDVGS